MIRAILISSLALSALSACAPAPSTTLTEFYARNEGRSPHHQTQINTIPHCIDASDERHPGPPRGRTC